MIEIEEKTFCRMVKFYGKAHNLPPLASKIYAYLCFDFERQGLTFDELVDVFGVSKSSVSTNLNLLIKSKLVTDVARLDERKRYFQLNNDFIKIRFNDIVERLKEELSIIESLEEVREGHLFLNKDKGEIYKQLLRRNITNIKESLTHL